MVDTNNLWNFFVFIIAILGGLFIANLILTLFNSPYRISFLGSILFTLLIFGAQMLLSNQSLPSSIN